MRVIDFPVLAPSGFYRMTCSDWGDPRSGRVLVCVHGLSRNRHDFDFLAESLSEDGWRVVVPDMPGRGDSAYFRDPADYSMTNYVPICAALLARLECDQLSWFGTSMGGILGMVLAAQPDSPICQLVLNDIGPFIPGQALQRIAGYIGLEPRFESLGEVEAALRVGMASFGVIQDEHWQFLAKHAVEPVAGGGWRLRYDPAIAVNFLKSLEDIVLWPVWEAIRARCLVIRGNDSDLLTAETAKAMTETGPKADLHVIAGSGHAPMLFEPAQLAMVRSWLNPPGLSSPAG